MAQEKTKFGVKQKNARAKISICSFCAASTAATEDERCRRAHARQGSLHVARRRSSTLALTSAASRSLHANRERHIEQRSQTQSASRTTSQRPAMAPVFLLFSIANSQNKARALPFAPKMRSQSERQNKSVATFGFTSSLCAKKTKQNFARHITFGFCFPSLIGQ